VTRISINDIINYIDIMKVINIDEMIYGYAIDVALMKMAMTCIN